jgi:hypothetical protein
MPTDELETWVAEQLKKTAKWAGVTINSGAIAHDEDVKTDEYIIQCKRSTTKKNFIIERDDWEQLRSASISHRKADGDYRTPVFVVENSEGTKLAAMEANDLFLIMWHIKRLGTISDKYNNMVSVLKASGVYDSVLEKVQEKGTT